MAETTLPVQSDAPQAQPGQPTATIPSTTGGGTQPIAPQTQPAPTVSVSERTTEQFEKLKESNKKLFEANRLLQEELVKRARTEQTFAPIQQVPSTTVPTPSLEQFVTEDPITGEKYVDDKKLATVLSDATQRATRAEVAVQNYIRQQQALDQERQEVEAYSAHPEVNPSSQKFDAKISDLTRALLLDSMMNPQSYEGRQLTFREAADRANGMTPAQAQVAGAKAQQAQQALEMKQQVTAQATGVSTNVAQQVVGGQSDDLEVLRDKTRKGRGDETIWAIAQRLSKIPHAGTPTSSTQA